MDKDTVTTHQNKKPTMLSSFWRKRKTTTKRNISSDEFEKDCEIIPAPIATTTKPVYDAMKPPPMVLLSPPLGVMVEPIVQFDSAIGYKNKNVDSNGFVDGSKSINPIRCFDEDVRSSIRRFINCID